MSTVRARSGDLQGHAIELSGVELLKLSVEPQLAPCRSSLSSRGSWLLQGQNHDYQLRRPYVRCGFDQARSSGSEMTWQQPACRSLQIFRDEAHAATHSRATKEGLSLFGEPETRTHSRETRTDVTDFSATGIANLTRTPLGRAKMRDWFLRPSLELNVIEQRHDAVECFLREDNREGAVVGNQPGSLPDADSSRLLLQCTSSTRSGPTFARSRTLRLFSRSLGVGACT